MCFDTAPTNTGVHHDAGVELEKVLGRELIWLPCRHHIFEIILKSVFEAYWPTQSGPNVQLFNRFKVSWDAINKLNYKSGTEDDTVANILKDQTNHILVFIEDYMQKYHPRSDYEEFLELSLIFLGATPKEKVSFKRPGAMSHARRMAKAIYCLKIFILETSSNLMIMKKKPSRSMLIHYYKLHKSMVFFTVCYSCSKS
ncbi:GSCOCG00011453001-RA-CDS [Cotesia congregata]|nr:GSCOCG00011453001-RA-CDS [Cotesia congregata]